MSDRGGRDALRGAEVQVVDLLFEVVQPEEWAGCLELLRMRLPMAARSGREALREAEVQMFDLIFEVFPSERWAGLLKALLESAANKGYRDLARTLVRAGAEMGDALHEAVRGGHGGIMSDLLESGASFEAKDAGGFTPLHIAAYDGEPEMVQLLLLKGADKDALTNNGWTPLYIAAHQGHVAAALALLTAGADSNLRCGGQIDAAVTHITAQQGHVEILRAVIEHGAELEAVTLDQRTALHLAALTNKAEAIDVLVEAGANIEARDRHGRTPLHVAAAVLRREALLNLLKHGAVVNAQNNSLKTPLIVAVRRAGMCGGGAAIVVDSLLRAGADETILNHGGKKAADMIGAAVEEDLMAEDVEHVQQLLARAPADRAWRRRGYLVLCRAHLDRVQQGQVISGTHRTDTPPRTRSHAKLARAAGVARDSNVDGSSGGGWAVVVAKVLRLQEEGIFRTIVGYL